MTSPIRESERGERETPGSLVGGVPGSFDATRNSTQRGRNTLKFPASNSSLAASGAQGERAGLCQFDPSVQLVQLTQAAGSAARLCKDHSQHLFTPRRSSPLPPFLPRRGCGGLGREGSPACREIPHRVNLDQIENRKPQASTRRLCENR